MLKPHDVELIKCIQGNNLNGVSNYINNGADVNCHTENTSLCPLLYSICLGHVDIFFELIQNGADPSFKNTDGLTPIDYLEGSFASAIPESKIIIDWIKKYENQKMLIERFNTVYLSLKKNNLLNDIIREEYYYLDVCSELNLI